MTTVNKLAIHLLGDKIHWLPKHMHLERMTGKTTGIALQQISEAILNPEVKIKIGERGGLHDTSPGGFIDYLNSLIEKLELKFMSINRITKELVYEPFEELDDKPVDETLNNLLLAINKAVSKQDYDAASSYSQAYQRIKATK